MNDLATFVVGLAENPPEAPPKKEPTDNPDDIQEEEPQGQYFFAFDGNNDRRLVNLIENISKVVGSGEYETQEWTDLIKKKYNFYFTLDLWALPSPLLIAVPNKYQPGYVEPDAPDTARQPDGDDNPPADPIEPIPEPEDPPFEWHAKSGILEHGRKILAEFSKSHSNFN